MSISNSTVSPTSDLLLGPHRLLHRQHVATRLRVGEDRRPPFAAAETDAHLHRPEPLAGKLHVAHVLGDVGRNGREDPRRIVSGVPFVELRLELERRIHPCDGSGHGRHHRTPLVRHPHCRTLDVRGGWRRHLPGAAGTRVAHPPRRRPRPVRLWHAHRPHHCEPGPGGRRACSSASASTPTT